MTPKKIILLLVVLSLIAMFFAFDLQQVFNLENSRHNATTSLPTRKHISGRQAWAISCCMCWLQRCRFPRQPFSP